MSKNAIAYVLDQFKKSAPVAAPTKPAKRKRGKRKARK